MKPFIEKFFAKQTRWEFLFLLVPFLLWIYCFRHFFSGSLWLQADAVSYAYHIDFYTNNLSHGIYPLWDPAWVNGAPYHFFLRRIGDVNPLLFLIVALKMVGVPSAGAYLIFLGAYYFLAASAIYLIARILFVDRFLAFAAYVLFLFSSWGSEVFYNYIIIIFVPLIWFFYFLLCFAQKFKKGHFLGMCFCLGLVVTTYIPFFFLIILAIFAFFYILFYGRVFMAFLKQSLKFVSKNKIFTCFCVFFLLASCVPALIFYKESKSNEFVLPNRHMGADDASAITVGLQNVASGDIINHGYFDRLFDDHKNLDMGDIFIPYIFFLLLISTVAARINKLIFFLLFNILALSLITITSAAGVHKFLYDHIILFKFIRNIYYFFWLAMLPMAILLSISAFKSLLTAITQSTRKGLWLVYLVICHLAFALFLWGREGVLSGAWACIIISMVYFWVYLKYGPKISYPAGFCAVLLAVFIQSAQIYACLDQKIAKFQKDGVIFDQAHKGHKSMKMEIYYGSSWFTILVNYIDPDVLEGYRNHQFILYDNVIPYKDNQEFFKTLQSAMSSNTNIAFVSGYETKPADWRKNPDSNSQADVDPVSSGKLSVIRSDANTWVLRSHLTQDQFLVVNDNYNSKWHAFINGRKAPLFRANVSFKGIWLPAGESNIILRFSSPSRYALHLSLIALYALTFIYLLVLLRKQRRSAGL